MFTIESLMLIVNSCNIHLFDKIIVGIKCNLFWTTFFLCYESENHTFYSFQASADKNTLAYYSKKGKKYTNVQSDILISSQLNIQVLESVYNFQTLQLITQNHNLHR
jgi:hypothetical protein